MASRSQRRRPQQSLPPSLAKPQQNLPPSQPTPLRQPRLHPHPQRHRLRLPNRAPRSLPPHQSRLQHPALAHHVQATIRLHLSRGCVLRVSVLVVLVRVVHALAHPALARHAQPAPALHAPVLPGPELRAQVHLVRVVQSHPSWQVPLRQRHRHQLVAAVAAVAQVAALAVQVVAAVVPTHQAAHSAAVVAANAVSPSARSARN